MNGLRTIHLAISSQRKNRRKAAVSDEEVIEKCAEIVRSVSREVSLMASEGRISPAELHDFKRQPIVAWVQGCSIDHDLEWLDDEDKRRNLLAKEIASTKSLGSEAAKAISRAALALFELERLFSTGGDMLPHQVLGTKGLRSILGED